MIKQGWCTCTYYETIQTGAKNADEWWKNLLKRSPLSNTRKPSNCIVPSDSQVRNCIPLMSDTIISAMWKLYYQCKSWIMCSLKACISGSLLWSSMTSNEYMYNIYLEDFLFVTDMPWNFFAHFCFCLFVFFLFWPTIPAWKQTFSKPLCVECSIIHVK